MVPPRQLAIKIRQRETHASLLIDPLDTEVFITQVHRHGRSVHLDDVADLKVVIVLHLASRQREDDGILVMTTVSVQYRATINCEFG